MIITSFINSGYNFAIDIFIIFIKISILRREKTTIRMRMSNIYWSVSFTEARK
jgi:hypothetical protein